MHHTGGFVGGRACRCLCCVATSPAQKCPDQTGEVATTLFDGEDRRLSDRRQSRLKTDNAGM